MCTMDCYRWASKNIRQEEVKGKRIIEVGSYDVNGSLRYVVELFKPAEYIGVDITQGPGVDVICSSDNLIHKFGKESFDLVISTCALEHIKDWKISISNIKNICKKNGVILIIVPSVFPYHAFPYDFWRYSLEDVKSIFSDCEIISLSEDLKPPSLVYAKIKKLEQFNEKDLSKYELHSVILNKRVVEIKENDLKTLYFKLVVFKSIFKDTLLNIGHRLISKF